MKITISAVILTYNEEKNIEDCLKSIYDWVDEIFIVDSYSSDNTCEISKKYTDKIRQRPFKTQSEQFNWALDNLPIKGEWVIRLDADERVTAELKNEILQRLPKLDKDTNGLYVKRRVYFMGKWIRHGGYYPIWLLRIWKKAKARSEERPMNENIVLLEGRAEKLRYDIIDFNQKNITSWIDKHNLYATRYAEEIISMQNGSTQKTPAIAPRLFGSQAQRKRWLQQNFFIRMPLFIRSFLYFLYRYFFMLGFLDGKEGLIFHFLQGFWYYFLVDAKIYEYRKKG